MELTVCVPNNRKAIYRNLPDVRFSGVIVRKLLLKVMMSNCR
jgi:hypothetical protein